MRELAAAPRAGRRAKRFDGGKTLKPPGLAWRFEWDAGSPPGLPGGVRQPDTLTPIEAMSLLYELKQKLK